MKTAIVDPAPGCAEAVTQYIESHNLVPDKILLTHSHWDHIADTKALKTKYDIPVYIHEEDAENLKNPGSDGLPCWINIPGVTPDKFLTEGDLIDIGDLQLQVIFTPGHTPGGVCFYSEKQKFLLSGDTLFKGSIGNLSFPTARPHLMWVSLDKLAKLPGETKVFPGHGPTTTIATEAWLPKAETIYG